MLNNGEFCIMSHSIITVLQLHPSSQFMHEIVWAGDFIQRG